MHKALDNIPIPKPKRVGTPRWKYPYATMDVGAMFFVPGKKHKSLSTYTSAIGRRLGRKFITRSCWMIPVKDGWQMSEEGVKGAVFGIGVWRMR